MRKVWFLGAIALSLNSFGCSMFHANSPSNTTAKEVISTLSAGAAVLDGVCAITAANLKDPQLAQDCGDAYDRTRVKLAAAQVALDNGDKSFVCAVKLSTSALQDFADIYRNKVGSVPEAVTVALAVGGAVGSQCKE